MLLQLCDKYVSKDCTFLSNCINENGCLCTTKCGEIFKMFLWYRLKILCILEVQEAFKKCDNISRGNAE